MKFTVALLMATALLSGCASTVPHVTPLRLAEFAQLQSPPKGPLVIELLPGDRVRLNFVIESSHFDAKANESFAVVKERCFLVFPGDGPPRLSYDGKHYVRGRLAAGLGAENGTTTLSVALKADP